MTLLAIKSRMFHTTTAKSVAAALAGACILLVPVGVSAQVAVPAPAKLPVYDAVAIKPSKADPGSWSTDGSLDRFSARNVSFKDLLAQASGIRRELISGIPEPIGSARFDIEAKVVEPDVEALKKLTTAQRDSMVLAILLERFKLSEHIETRVSPILELQLAKGGPKFKESATADEKNEGTSIHNTEMEAKSVTMEQLAAALTHQVQRTVIDKTGLTARYDLTLKWSHDNGVAVDDGTRDAPPLIFTALKEQLGLKLEPAKGPVDTLVVDHVEMPSEN